MNNKTSVPTGMLYQHHKPSMLCTALHKPLQCPVDDNNNTSCVLEVKGGEQPLYSPFSNIFLFLKEDIKKKQNQCRHLKVRKSQPLH